MGVEYISRERWSFFEELLLGERQQLGAGELKLGYIDGVETKLLHGPFQPLGYMLATPFHGICKVLKNHKGEFGVNEILIILSLTESSCTL